jgi:hypothetical protein
LDKISSKVIHTIDSQKIEAQAVEIIEVSHSKEKSFIFQSSIFKNISISSPQAKFSWVLLIV